MFRIPLYFGILFSLCVIPVRAGDPVPAGWLAGWSDPPAADRPLQMVHGRDLTNPETALYYRDKCGLGGLVRSRP